MGVGAWHRLIWWSKFRFSRGGKDGSFSSFVDSVAQQHCLWEEIRTSWLCGWPGRAEKLFIVCCDKNTFHAGTHCRTESLLASVNAFTCWHINWDLTGCFRVLPVSPSESSLVSELIWCCSTCPESAGLFTGPCATTRCFLDGEGFTARTAIRKIKQHYSDRTLLILFYWLNFPLVYTVCAHLGPSWRQHCTWISQIGLRRNQVCVQIQCPTETRRGFYMYFLRWNTFISSLYLTPSWTRAFHECSSFFTNLWNAQPVLAKANKYDRQTNDNHFTQSFYHFK